MAGKRRNPIEQGDVSRAASKLLGELAEGETWTGSWRGQTYRAEWPDKQLRSLSERDGDDTTTLEAARARIAELRPQVLRAFGVDESVSDETLSLRYFGAGFLELRIVFPFLRTAVRNARREQSRRVEAGPPESLPKPRKRGRPALFESAQRRTPRADRSAKGVATRAEKAIAKAEAKLAKLDPTRRGSAKKAKAIESRIRRARAALAGVSAYLERPRDEAAYRKARGSKSSKTSYRPRLPSGNRPRVSRSENDCQVAAELAGVSGCAVAPRSQAALAEGVIYDSEGRPYDYEPAVFQLEELLTSHDEHFREDARYPQKFQARDRGSDESRLDIQRMARELDPVRLTQLGPSPTEGAPIVWQSRGRPIVLAGNGRVMALRLAAVEDRKGYLDRVEKVAGRRGVLVRLLRDSSEGEALALAAASQRSASAPETPIERARALMRGVTGIRSYSDLPLLNLERLKGPLDEKTVVRFEQDNPRIMAAAWPKGAPANPRARADRYVAVFVGLLPPRVVETIQALGLEAEQAFMGFAPFIAWLAQTLQAGELSPELAWLDPLPRLARAARLMERFRGQSRPQILAALTQDVENMHMFDHPLAGLEPPDVGWLLGLLSSLNVQSPEKKGVAFGRELRAHALAEAEAHGSNLFGYDPDMLSQIEAVFGVRVRGMVERFTENLGRMGLAIGGTRRNPVLIVTANPKKRRRNGKRRRRRKGWPPGARPIEELPDWMRRSPSFQRAWEATVERYGAEPDYFLPVRSSSSSGPVLAPIGEVLSMDYAAADGPGEPVTGWTHEGGDRGDDEAPSRPPLYAYDPTEDRVVIVEPPGTRLEFGERGIVG